jgi:hypothetical protein
MKSIENVGTITCDRCKTTKIGLKDEVGTSWAELNWHRHPWQKYTRDTRVYSNDLCMDCWMLVKRFIKGEPIS